MKKYISIFIVFALLFSFSACGKVYFDEEKYNSKVSEEESKSERESSEAESQIEADQSEVASEMGKSEKDKKLVLKFTYGNHIELMEVVFKNGKVHHNIIYKYFDSDEYYKTILGYGDQGSDKIIGHDDKTRMIQYKNDNFEGTDYETMRSIYERRDPNICQIIE